MAAAPADQRLRRFGVDAPRQQDRELHIAVRGFERLSRGLVIAMREVADHARRAPQELGVAASHLHHHSAIDAPEADHHQGGQEVEDRLLRRARLHPGGPGQNLGPGIDQNRVLGRGKERGARVVGDPDRQRAAVSRALDELERIGCRAAGRDPDHHVPRADHETLQRALRRLAVVLGVFGACFQRPLAAGDGEGDPVFRPVEGRRKLGPVLDADAARGPGAGVDEAPGFRQPLGGRFARADDLRQGLADGGHRRKLAFEHRMDGLETGPGVEILETGAVLFGAHRLDIQEKGCARLIASRQGPCPAD